MATFRVEAMVHGYHVYQCVWTPNVGNELPCRKEYGNTQDPFALAVLHGTTTYHMYGCVAKIDPMADLDYTI